MKLRKFGAAAAAVMLAFMIAATPVSAHHGRRHRSTRTSYPACTVEDCTITKNHKHNGNYYCGGSYSNCGNHGSNHH